MTAHTTIRGAKSAAVGPAPPSDVAPMIRVPAPPVVRIFKRIEQVTEAWQRLEAMGIESAGQSRVVVRQRIAVEGIPIAEQFFVLVEVGGDPVALLPLVRRRMGAVRVLGWAAGTALGACAPLSDRLRLMAMGVAGRRALWARVAAALAGTADLVKLEAVPVADDSGGNPFGEFGSAVKVGLRSSAVFANWEDAAASQWTKARRSHDWREGERLAAAGTVGFREVAGRDKRAPAILEMMLAQRQAAAAAGGSGDFWTSPAGMEFLRATVTPGSGIDARLQVLTLDRALVAIRHTVVVGDRMFCLATSASAETGDRIRLAEQCLLRVMHTVFERGIGCLDFGLAASIDERRWCNRFVAVSDRYLPLTAAGRAAAVAGIGWQVLRALGASPLARRVGRSAAAVAGMRGHKATAPAEPETSEPQAAVERPGVPG
jgi:CelD/BcsL family acetyltransferase involved in cellulose biosynthesis